MPKSTSSQFAFPGFFGVTRQLVLLNLIAFFALAIIGVVSSQLWVWIIRNFAMDPAALLTGQVWRAATYSLLHPMMNGAIIESLLEILSLWFLAGFLQTLHGSNWVGWLYWTSVVGAAIVEVLTYLTVSRLGFEPVGTAIVGAVGGLIGLMTAIGVLHAEVSFQLIPLPISIKAKYLAIIYILVAVAETFGTMRWYAFAQLGGAAMALVYIRISPRRGVGFVVSEQFYGLRNRYYRWKRRKAAKKFEVYMRKQGRTVRFDGQGRQIDEDHDDKKRWN